MATPVFEDIDPASDCDCPGCRLWHRVLPHSRAGRGLAHPASHRAVIVATATTAALGAGAGVTVPTTAHAAHFPGVPAAEEGDSPQGEPGPLYGNVGKTATPTAAPALPAITRSEIIDRARKWVTAKVPYSLSAYWSDGYRQDCSGYVSMAWNLPGNEWTGSLAQYGVRITKAELQPGDILLFHNAANPTNGSHVTIFGGWTDSSRTTYLAYEQTKPSTLARTTPYAYWSNSAQYVPYRYKGVTTGAAGAPSASGFPGSGAFGPGAVNAHVTRLGTMLVARGGGHFYTSGPGPRWTEADRRATEAFQRAQGWRGKDADGLPGPTTWRLLAGGKGKDIAPPASHGVPGFPGRGAFRPGAVNAYVTQLGERLVAKGHGAHYTTGPGPRWTEADRRNVEAFQRAQGWRGGAADGYPGPETWRRLFS